MQFSPGSKKCGIGGGGGRGGGIMVGLEERGKFLCGWGWVFWEGMGGQVSPAFASFARPRARCGGPMSEADRVPILGRKGGTLMKFRPGNRCARNGTGICAVRRSRLARRRGRDLGRQ